MRYDVEMKTNRELEKKKERYVAWKIGEARGRIEGEKRKNWRRKTEEKNEKKAVIKNLHK